MVIAVEVADNLDIRVHWIDKVIEEILKARNHQKLVYTPNLFRE